MTARQHPVLNSHPLVLITIFIEKSVDQAVSWRVCNKECSQSGVVESIHIHLRLLYPDGTLYSFKEFTATILGLK